MSSYSYINIRDKGSWKLEGREVCLSEEIEGKGETYLSLLTMIIHDVLRWTHAEYV